MRGSNSTAPQPLGLSPRTAWAINIASLLVIAPFLGLLDLLPWR